MEPLVDETLLKMEMGTWSWLICVSLASYSLCVSLPHVGHGYRGYGARGSHHGYGGGVARGYGRYGGNVRKSYHKYVTTRVRIPQERERFVVVKDKISTRTQDFDRIISKLQANKPKLIPVSKEVNKSSRQLILSLPNEQDSLSKSVSGLTKEANNITFKPEAITVPNFFPSGSKQQQKDSVSQTVTQSTTQTTSQSFQQPTVPSFSFPQRIKVKTTTITPITSTIPFTTTKLPRLSARPRLLSLSPSLPSPVPAVPDRPLLIDQIPTMRLNKDIFIAVPVPAVPDL